MILESTRALLRLFKTIESNTHLAPGGNITELEQVPAIVLEGPQPVEAMDMRRAAYKITDIDRVGETFTREPSPRFYDLRFSISLSAENALDLLNLLEKCSRLAHNFPVLTVTQETTQREREFSWEWETFPNGSGAPNASEIYEAFGSLRVRDVEVYSGVVETGTLITDIITEITPERS